MSRNRLHRPTWIAAIRAVQDEMLVLAMQTPLSDEQDRILTAAFRRCEELTAKRRTPAVPTDNELAAKYAISPRTVRNWRKAGCPFGAGQRCVLEWLAARRYAPAGAQAKFAKQLEQHKWRQLRRGFDACLANARNIKLAYKVNGIALPPDDWLRHFRCPRGSFG